MGPTIARQSRLLVALMFGLGVVMSFYDHPTPRSHLALALTNTTTTTHRLTTHASLRKFSKNANPFSGQLYGIVWPQPFTVTRLRFGFHRLTIPATS